jgi:hypothetical protein
VKNTRITIPSLINTLSFDITCVQWNASNPILIPEDEPSYVGLFLLLKYIWLHLLRILVFILNFFQVRFILKGGGAKKIKGTQFKLFTNF